MRRKLQPSRKLVEAQLCTIPGVLLWCYLSAWGQSSSSFRAFPQSLKQRHQWPTRMQEARVQKLNHSECSPRPRSTHGALRKQHPATPAAFPEMRFHTSEGRRAGKEHINNPDTSSFPFNKLLQLPWRNMSSAHGLNPLEHFQGLGFDKASSALGNSVVLHRDCLHPCWT